MVHRRRARQEQHQVGLEHARDEHLLAVHDVPIALADRRGLKLRRIGARVRLGDAERLESQRARRNLRQVLALLRLGAVPQHGPHDVHLGVAGTGVPPRVVDRLEDQPALANAEPRAHSRCIGLTCKHGRQNPAESGEGNE